jgi:hypothetical protein
MSWKPPTWSCDGTGDDNIDITHLGIPADPAFDLPRLLNVEFLIKDDTCSIDWANTTYALLAVKADPGVEWKLRIGGREHQGVGAL